ncbi:hypothetical protein PoB_005475500 [Plakobranchus ocellatus]|uniref:Uncharacterized protein n=1 Tax=Plakobranchus ocellatus TaxID=259542 RepID=A0AAV4C992_9GAST|nr:hypothetical protein PoB_005475500 [Plakobranchus ocellatus]
MTLPFSRTLQSPRRVRCEFVLMSDRLIPPLPLPFQNGELQNVQGGSSDFLTCGACLAKGSRGSDRVTIWRFKLVLSLATLTVHWLLLSEGHLMAIQRVRHVQDTTLPGMFSLVWKIFSAPSVRSGTKAHLILNHLSSCILILLSLPSFVPRPKKQIYRPRVFVAPLYPGVIHPATITSLEADNGDLGHARL